MCANTCSVLKGGRSLARLAWRWRCSLVFLSCSKRAVWPCPKRAFARIHAALLAQRPLTPAPRPVRLQGLGGVLFQVFQGEYPMKTHFITSNVRW